MAISAVSILNSGDPTDRTGTAYTTGAILNTGTSSDLLILRITGIMGTSVDPPAPTSVTGGGVTWTKHNLDNGTGILKWKTTSANRFSTSLWYAVGPLTLASTISISFGSNAMIGCQWQLVKISGADLSSGALAAIVQLASNKNETLATGGTLGLASPLSSPATSASRTFEFAFTNNNSASNDIESGYTLLARSPSQSNPAVAMFSGWNSTAFDTTPTIVNNTGSTQSYGLIAVEVKVAPVTTTVGTALEVDTAGSGGSSLPFSPLPTTVTGRREPTALSFAFGKMDGGENLGPPLDEMMDTQVTLFWGPYEGSLDFYYPVGGANWEQLLVDKQEIILLTQGYEREDICVRFYVQKVEYDGLEKQPVETYAHPSLPGQFVTRRQNARLKVHCAQFWNRWNEYTIQPLTGAITTHDKIWEAGTPSGEVIRWMLEDAHEHSALLEIDRDFDNTHTTDDVPWEKTVELTYSRGTLGLAPIQWLWEQHALDVRMRKRRIQATNWGTWPTNWTNADGPKILLASGRDFQDAPVVKDCTEKFNFVTVYGDEDRFAVSFDPDATSYLMKTEQASGVKDPVLLQEIADLWREFYSTPRIEQNYSLVLGYGHDPLVTYIPGDEVLRQDGSAVDPETFDAKPERIRLIQITMRKSATGDWSADAVFRDRLWQRAERFERQIRGLIHGGPGVVHPTRNAVAPEAPHGIGSTVSPPDVTTSIYTPPSGSGGKNYVRADVSGVWSGLDVDGVTCGDFSTFLVKWKYVSRGWTTLPASDDPDDVTGMIEGLEPGKSIVVLMGTQDVTGNTTWSEPASVDLPPDNGEYRALDGLGNPVFRVTDVGDWFATKVAGGALAATGPGIDLDSAQGVRIFGTGGVRTVHMDAATGDTDIAGNLHVHGITILENDTTINDDLVVTGTTTIGGTTTINDDLTINADTAVHGDFTVDGVSHLDGSLFLDADLDAQGHTIEGARLTTGTGNVVIDDDTISVGTNVITFSGSLLTTSGGLAVTGGLSTSSSLTVTGTATMNGAAHVGGGGGDLVSFHGGGGTVLQTITGSRGGNAALGDFLSKMAAKGLIIDGTGP